ncbi:MAG: sodium-translocating pyrophosphatase [Phycisphaerae bacterium]|nr:sodium-translocating pyrophosphatase [Phycisphaerae bacterium]
MLAQDAPGTDAAVTAETATAPAAAVRSVANLPAVWWVAPISSIIALLMAFYFYKSIMKANEGTDRMKEIAQHVREGAYAYLRRQYKVVAIFFVVVCVALIIVAFKFEAQHRLVPFAFLTGGFFSGLAGFFGMKTATNASARTAQGASESLNRGLQIAFRAGAVMGLTVVGLGLLDICGWFIYLYAFHHQVFQCEPMTLETITVVMLCFGMGASSQALFARVGGGIYTKAADVGADLVGKVEAGIPEDDPRNPATIADNVGDNVGDVAGMGADLYESYCGSILATAALGVAAMISTSEAAAMKYLIAPMVLAGVGIVLSVLGIFVVRTKEGATMRNLLSALGRGVNLSSILIAVAAAFMCSKYSESIGLALPWGVFGAIVTGLLAGIIIGKATEYYTAAEFKPTQRVADSANTGPATVAIAGLAEGMLSTWIPILVVGVAMVASFTFCKGWDNLTLGLYGVGIAAVGMLSTLGITLATDAYGPIADNAGGNAEMSGLGPKVRERTDALDSLGNTTAATGKGFAIGSAALTALALLAAYVEEVRVGIHREVASAYTVPAGGAAMAFSCVNPDSHTGRYKAALYVAPSDGHAPADLHHREMLTLSLMQAAGSSRTISLPESIAIPGNLPRGGWVPVQVGELLINNASVWQTLGLADVGETKAAYTKKAGLDDFMTFYNVTPMNPKFLVGVFFGVLLVFIFSALTMKAVGRAAMAMVAEVRRQFREIAGIMEGKGKPDYARCVAISTAGAQREMILPSMLALVVPLVVGLVLDVSGVMGLLVGGLCCGFAVAVYMANAGGAWDNAKKYIETGKHGGKRSDAHKAAVVGDTIGDPFKDTSGPSLNILIKLMSMVSVVFAGFVVKAAPYISGWLESLGK